MGFPMLLPIAVIAAVCFTLAACAGVLWKLSRAVRPAGIDAGWWDHFSAEKYAPLAHLLDASEFAFLKEQCGGNRGLLRHFRAQRARIARGFLFEMRSDFERLQALGQALVVAGRCEAGFQEELFRQRVRFTRSWWRVRVQVWLWQIGIGCVDAERLLESMRASAAAVHSAFAPAS